MSDIGCGLTGLPARDDGVRINETESIDDDFAFHGLDGVNNDCH